MPEPHKLPRIPEPSALYFEWLALLLAAIAFCFLAVFNQWFWRLNSIIYDTTLRAFSRPAPNDMVLLAIDDESISRVGQWPWPREIHARAINRLTEAGTQAVLFDILFNEPSFRDRVADLSLADAIRQNGRIILPLIHESTAVGPRERGPTARLLEAAAGIGHVHSELDLDGMIRSTYLYEGLGSPRWPHASLSLLQLLKNDKTFAMDMGETAPGGFKRDEKHWQRQNWFHIPFFGAPGHYRTYSYARWVTGEIPDEVVAGKIVFVGITATGLGDDYPTPVSGFSRPMPGVEISMHIFESLRSGINIKTVPPFILLCVITFSLVLLFLSFLRFRPGTVILLVALMILMGLYGAYFLLLHFHLLMISSVFLICVIIAYPLWNWRRLASALRFLEQENDALLKQAKKLSLKPIEGHVLSFEPVSRSIEMLRDTRQQLEQGRQEREVFLNFLSHDMRSPQSSILTMIEMRRRHLSMLNDEEIFQKIAQYARKTSSLADDFVQLAKAEQLTSEAFKEVELTAVIDEALDALWPIASERKITFQRDYEKEAYTRGHAALLGRVVSNLIHNAIKFSHEQGVVTASIFDQDEHWQVSIKDEGVGLSEEAQKRLMGLPDSAQGTHEVGLVMGLTLVRVILEQHGSALKVESTFGQGARFYFNLPKIVPHD